MGMCNPFCGGAARAKHCRKRAATFDIAYSMRASTFRGAKQITLQFEDFQIVDEAPPELRKRKIEIVDYRLEAANLSALADALAKLQEQAPAIQIWAEGADKAKGKSRFELQLADEFAIYTTPPSPTELQAALETVRPKKVYLIGVSPASEKADVFLSRLAGLAKYTINQKSGKVMVRELAAATGQREGTIDSAWSGWQLEATYPFRERKRLSSCPLETAS